jgi:hypothetical protein
LRGQSKAQSGTVQELKPMQSSKWIEPSVPLP